MNKMKQQQPFVAAMLLLFLKALLFRYFVFDGVAWAQVAADLASIMFLAGLIDAVSPARFKKFTLWSLNLLISFLLFAATVYYNYFSTIPTLSAFSELRQVGGVKESVFDSIQTRNLLFFVDLVALAAGWFILRLLGRTRIQQDRNDLISVRVWRFGVIGAAVVGLIVSQLYIWHAAKIENELAHAEEVGFINY